MSVTTFVVVVHCLDPKAVINLDEIKSLFHSLELISPADEVEVKILLGSLEELIMRNAQDLMSRRRGKQKEIEQLKTILAADRRRAEHG